MNTIKSAEAREKIWEVVGGGQVHLGTLLEDIVPVTREEVLGEIFNMIDDGMLLFNLEGMVVDPRTLGEE